MRASAAITVGLLLNLAAATACAEESVPGGIWPPGSFEVKAPDFGGRETIVNAAQKVAVVHRDKGAREAFKLIKQCYEDVGQPNQYDKALVSCITKDYLETTVLVKYRDKLSPEVVDQIDSASAETIMSAFNRRFSEATKNIAFSFSSPKPIEAELHDMSEQHGLPVYLAIAFPEFAGKVGPNATGSTGDGKK